MNILSRFAEIMSANINAFLEQIEGRNADKLLQKYILDAENDLGQIKSQTAAVMAEEKKAQRRLEECEAEIEKYGRYAVSAVRQGDDNDARKFLAYQKELEQKKMGLEETFRQARENAVHMRQMTEKLYGNLEAASAKLNDIRAKVAMAKSQEKINQMQESIGEENRLEMLSEAAQRRLDKAQAAAELNQGPEDEMSELIKKYEEKEASEADCGSVEEKLRRLKENME